MGDTIEGSSGAAQSAQQDIGNIELAGKIPQNAPENRSFFSRIVGALSPSDAPEFHHVQPSNDDGAAMGGTASGGIQNLRRMRLEEVAIPKAEIISVPKDISKDELVQVFRDSGMSRLPVFDGTLDTPIGIIHLKDFALKHGFNGAAPADFSVTESLRPLLYAPPSMPIGVLLQKMQSDRRHLALIIDEYGGVDGLVTIEDLIETVIGEIEDEHDIEESELWVAEKPGCYTAQARTPLDDFEAEIGVSLREGIDDDEVDTLGGVVFVLSGQVPARGEIVRHPSGVEFEVIDADPRRIKRLRVELPAKLVK